MLGLVVGMNDFQRNMNHVGNFVVVVGVGVVPAVDYDKQAPEDGNVVLKNVALKNVVSKNEHMFANSKVPHLSEFLVFEVARCCLEDLNMTLVEA